MEYIDTPRTEAGNTTFMGSGHNPDDLSMENSFHSPKKREFDLASHMRNSRGLNLRTPSARTALTDRRNFQTNRRSGEFTPLLKSATKRHAFRGKENILIPKTPAFLKEGIQGRESPALHAPESSGIYGSEPESFVKLQGEMTPLPHIASSSVQSTPLAKLTSRTGDRMLDDQRNLMTLREQENIIDRIEKENFGLKLKIHFLQEYLRKSDPNLNQNALKENTDLHADKAILQRDLARIKKQLSASGQEAELLKQQLQDDKEQSQRDQAAQELREELLLLRENLEAKDTEIEALQIRLSSGDKNCETERLKGDIQDLEAELREKDRLIDDKDDELENLDIRLEKAMQSQDLLAESREKVKELEKSQESVMHLKDEAQKARRDAEEANEARDEACRERKKAIEDLDEVREEMANKSFTTKGMNRQMEEKADKLQKNFEELRTRHTELQNCLDDKSREARKLQDVIDGLGREAEHREHKLANDNEILRHENIVALHNNNFSATELKRTSAQLCAKSDEKNLLQARHDALTMESHSLQSDLVRCRAEVTQLQSDLEQERQRSCESEGVANAEARKDVDRLSKEIEVLHRQLDEAKHRHVQKEESFNTFSRDLKLQKDKAEQRANALQRTLEEKLESEGTLTGKEVRLQRIIENERKQYKGEEALLGRQIRELTTDADNKRKAWDESQFELLALKEELRVRKKDQSEAKEKVQALEDEVDVLQASLEQESNREKGEVAAARHEVESLRRQHHANKQEIARIETAHASAQAEIEMLQSDFRANQESNIYLKSRVHDLEGQLSDAESEKQTLHDQVAKANNDIQTLQSSFGSGDHEIIHNNISTLREKESDFAQKELSYRDNIRALQQQIENLENKLHQMNLSRLGTDSPKSLASAPTKKYEVIEAHPLLVEAQQQVESLLTKIKDVEKDASRKVADVEKVSRQQSEEFASLRDRLEQQVTNHQLEQDSYRTRYSSAETTIARLRDRIASLTSDLREVHISKASDETIASERKDLHEMLKSAKLEAEDLQFQLTERQSRDDVTAVRERELRLQLQSIRSERSRQQHKSCALVEELKSMQNRYEDKVNELAAQQQNFLAERKALVSRVRFPNMSVSSLHEDLSALKLVEVEAREKEKRHGAELKGLAKQIQWLRARCKREEGFRVGLAFEKRFLMMQIEMFRSCNTADLRLLEEMGATPDKRVREKRPSLRAVGYAIIAGIKMQKLQREWTVQKRLQASIAKKMILRSGKRKTSLNK